MMTEAEAEDEIKRMVAWSRYPSISQGDIDRLIVLAKRRDSDDNAPGDAGWTPTWDLNYAAMEGWKLKMSKAVGEVTFTSHFKKFDQSNVINQCKMMHDIYAKSVVQSARSQGSVAANA